MNLIVSLSDPESVEADVSHERRRGSGGKTPLRQDGATEPRVEEGKIQDCPLKSFRARSWLSVGFQVTWSLQDLAGAEAQADR